MAFAAGMAAAFDSGGIALLSGGIALLQAWWTVFDGLGPRLAGADEGTRRMRSRTLPFLVLHSTFHALDHAWEMEDQDLSGRDGPRPTRPVFGRRAGVRNVAAGCRSEPRAGRRSRVRPFVQRAPASAHLGRCNAGFGTTSSCDTGSAPHQGRRRRHPWRVTSVKRMALGVSVLGWLALAPAAFGYTPGSAYGFAGDYVARDCATWWEEGPGGLHDVDCSVWGDDSLMTLSIGRGRMPSVTLLDTSASFCINQDLPARFRGVGYGTFTDQHTLVVTLTTVWCGSVRVDPSGSFGLYGPDPTLWNDDDGDGWGTVWYPTS